MNEITNRLEALRSQMRSHGMQAYIVTSWDAHLSEYTPERWLGRSWISGFTGSAGTMLVTLEGAYLWTDSRYFLQASQELSGSGIELMKQGMVGIPSLEAFLASHLPQGSMVGSDGACMSAEEASQLRGKLSAVGIGLNLDLDLLDLIWSDRPGIPSGELFEQDSHYSGQTTEERIADVRKRLAQSGANATLITMLCELAWVFNIRGYDVEFNPVGVGFGYISSEEAILFTLPSKIPSSLREHLEASGVSLRGYDEIDAFVEGLPLETILYVDSRRITERLLTRVPKGVAVRSGISILTQLKAVKNEVELEGLRRAMRRDGVSLTRFFKWLEEFLASGGRISEYDLGVKLHEFRSRGELFYGDSFGTISGYLGHGAIVHYKAEPETSYTIEGEGVLLLDSGGQYLDGTTDITRTLALSAPSEKLKQDYTLVLKGHIAIAQARFPEGTCGCQLDILARKALWDRGLNYGHGTGHGVGHFLNVHEGPQNIRTDLNPTPLEIGMVTSNEPGLYRTGEYGIRIENLIVTRLEEETEFGRFFGFETVTLCYLDNSLVQVDLLTQEERDWYNAYQERVFQELKSDLTDEEAAWLRIKTQAI